MSRTAAGNLSSDLRRLARALESDAAELNAFADAVDMESATETLKGSCIAGNTLSRVMRVFNTSNRVSAAEAAIRSAYTVRDTG